MNIFDEREKAFEAKYRNDQETQFKINIRRDKLLGLWAAAKMGLEGDAAQAYARSVVDAEFSEPDHDASHKVVRDFASAGIDIAEKDVQIEMSRCREQARVEILTALKG